MNKAMSEDSIRIWLKKNKHALECNDKDRIAFEENVQRVLSKLRVAKNFDFDD
jgi:hypothetical protein